jgi:hypothetical protein
MSQSSATLSETIKIAELAGQQEFKIKLKQSEALPGPKVRCIPLKNPKNISHLFRVCIQKNLICFNRVRTRFGI